LNPESTQLQADLNRLSPAEQERLAAILDEYLVGLERGNKISPEQLFADHYDYEPFLKRCLSGLNLFHKDAVQACWAETLPLASELVPTTPGRMIGEFRIDREIARGGMGVVYEAVQTSLQRQVALKVLPFSSTHDAKHIARFKNEAQAAAQLRHPNIVPVYAIGEHNGIHFYAMQLIAGSSLTSLLEQLRANDHTQSTAHGIIDHVRVVARMGVQAAEALHAAHELGIVHRDVKPSNLIVDDDGKLWITDFGLARCRETSGLTESGDIVGTMRYMSPEQALGHNTLVDHRTDVYSLGVTLYELAALHHPAGQKSDIEIMTNRLRVQACKLRVWNRHIPVDFETIIMKAIADSPSERYATAQELADDLNRFLLGQPILASPPSVLNRAVKLARRHRRVVYVSAGVALLALVAQTYNAWLLAASIRDKDVALANAQQSLQDARDVLSRTTLLGDQLKSIPGTEGVRYQLLEVNREHYQRLKDRTANDPRLATELALATSKLGTLNELLGKKQDALQLQHDARDLWLARQAAEPTVTEHSRNLALTDNNIAKLLADLGKSQAADELLAEAEQVLGKLRDARPNDDSLAADWATTINNHGLVFRQLGRPDQATEKIRDAIAAYQKLLTRNNNDQAVLQGLAASYNNLSSMIKDTAPVEAVQVFEQAIEIQRQLVQSSPSNRAFQAELARTYNNLGYVLASKEAWLDAMHSYENAVALQERLVKASPLLASYRRDLAVSYNNLGMMQTRSERLPDGQRSFDRAVQLQRQLLEAEPSDPKLLSNLGGTYNNLALLLDQQNHFADAEVNYKRAISLQRRAREIAPTIETYAELLTNHYANYAKCLRRQDKQATADAVTPTNHQIPAHYAPELAGN
jgi:serine/threonine protein kinase/Flp pilus assembly protein TadD